MLETVRKERLVIFLSNIFSPFAGLQFHARFGLANSKHLPDLSIRQEQGETLRLRLLFLKFMTNISFIHCGGSFFIVRTVIRII